MFRDLERFVHKTYLANGGAGTGLNPESPLPFVTGDLWSIPAGCIIDKMYMVIYTAITGTTNLDVGDDDDADGYIDSSLSVTLGTPGLYGYDAKLAGAYLRVSTAGVTDPADLYVVPAAKYYSAVGKEVKLAATTANTAGKVVVICEGYMATNPF